MDSLIKAEAGQASIVLTFKIINDGKKVAQTPIILKLKKIKGSYLPLWTFLSGDPPCIYP